MELRQIIKWIYGSSVRYTTGNKDASLYESIEIIHSPDGFVLPSEKGLRDLEPEANEKRAMNFLRNKRNDLLTNTDWWGVSDHTMTNGQKTYRQELRDFPSTATIKLDEEGRLSNITWPEKPE